MTSPVSILTPVGRLVNGSPFEPQTLDAEGRPLVVKSGPNAGQPRTSYFVALAVPKNDPGVNAIIQSIVSVARQSFPQYFDAAGNCTRPGFAFKFTDGDSTVPNSRGSRPCDREGYPGNWVFKFNNGYAPKCYTKGGAALITNKDEIKCGYYVRIYATVAGNEALNQPGVFLNVQLIELVGYGEEITFGPSGDQVFGGSPVAALPAGASATPIAPRVPIQPPAGAFVPPPMVQPAPDFLNPPAALVAPPPPAAPAPIAPPPAAAEEYYIAPNNARVSKTALIAAGWAPAQIATLKRG